MSLDSPRYTATHLLLESAKAITSEIGRAHV